MLSKEQFIAIGVLIQNDLIKDLDEKVVVQMYEEIERLRGALQNIKSCTPDEYAHNCAYQALEATTK